MAVAIGLSWMGSTQAAIRYWDTSTDPGLQGGAGTWDFNTTAAWSDSEAGSSSLLKWSNGNDAVFSGATTATVSNNTVYANSIAFNGTGNTVTSSTMLVVNGGGITANESATINGNRVEFGASQAWNVAADKTLSFSTTYNGGLVNLGNGMTWTKQGDGTASLYKLGTAASGDGTATFSIAAGKVTTSDMLIVGNGASTGSYGVLNVASGAELTVGKYLYVGNTGNGTVNQDGGTVSCLNTTYGVIFAGGKAGVSGAYNLNGGVLKTALITTSFGAGFGNSMVLNMNGGALENIRSTTKLVSNIAVAIGNNGGVFGGANGIKLNGVFSGAGKITKTGAGTLELLPAAGSTFTGAVDVEEGILQIESDFGAGGDVTVSGGILYGWGSLNRNVIISSGGSIAPIDLVIGGNLTLGGVYEWGLDALTDDSLGTPGTDWDLIEMSGGSVLGNGWTLELDGVVPSDDSFWGKSHLWTVLTGAGSINLSGGSIVGTGYTPGEFGSFGVQAAGGDLALAWTPCPEPSAVVLLIGAAFGLVVYAWRRRR